MPKSAGSFSSILLIDTTQTNRTSVAAISGRKVATVSENVRAQDLQELITKALAKVKISLTDLEAVAVLTGPGSYTGTRMGIVTANVLGWLIDIPLLAIKNDNFELALAKLRRGDHFVTSRQVKVVY